MLVGTRFESSSHETPQFAAFYTKFVKAVKLELKKINATEIKLSKGHFFISGFFKVGEQCFYISLSDVRDNEANLLIRTAKDYKDYSGGANHYVEIDTYMAKKIARMFRLDYIIPTKKVDTSLDVDKLTSLLQSKGYISVRVPSNKKAYNLAWKLSKMVGLAYGTISGKRYGRKVHSIYAENEIVSFHYDCGSKSFEMNLAGFDETKLLQSLIKYKEGAVVKNPFSGIECNLNAEQLALYDFVKGAEAVNSPNFSLGLGTFRLTNLKMGL
jgi:hypothetical protein